MPSREFRGADGVEWRVWSVIAGRRGEGERRHGYDRRSPEPVLRYTGLERRSNTDRRSAAHLLASEYRSGWLVFESADERRRLAPIPPGWERLSEGSLVRLCQAAVARDGPGSQAASRGNCYVPRE